MYIHVTDPALLPELLSFLRQRPDCVAEIAGETQIAVGLLGSRDATEKARELAVRLEPWVARNGGARVELGD